MTALAMVPLFNVHQGDAVLNAYVTGVAVVWALAVFVMLGYLVVAVEPDGDDADGILFAGLSAGLLWPAVAFLPLVALVFGLRWMVHGPKPSLSRVGRRDARIRRRDERIAELERELKL